MTLKHRRADQAAIHLCYREKLIISKRGLSAINPQVGVPLERSHEPQVSPHISIRVLCPGTVHI